MEACRINLLLPMIESYPVGFPIDFVIFCSFSKTGFQSCYLPPRVGMAILTDSQLQQIATAHGVVRRQNIIISGDFRRLRFMRKTFVVLDDIDLCCYENESNWRHARTPSLRLLRSSIVSIACSATTIEIEYISDQAPRLARLKLACDNRSQIDYWRALLQANIPGKRSIKNFASTLRLPKEASIRQIVDCIGTAFPKDVKKGGGCFQPGCTFASAPRTKYCPFHKRIHADRQFRFQIGRIRRLIEDCRMDLEQAVADVIADVTNDEQVRRDSIQLLWDICACIKSGTYQEPLVSESCELGALKFLNHIALMSQRQTPDLVIFEGLLDVLLQRTSTSLGDCQVRRPGAWRAVLSILAAFTPDHRRSCLHMINFLLIGNKHNCSTLSAQDGWQQFVYSAMVSERDGINLIVALSLNIFVVMSYDALVNSDHFLSIANETLLQIHHTGGLDQTSLVISRVYLIGLSKKIAANVNMFPIDIGSRAWVQCILFSNVVLRYLFRTSDWGQDKPKRNRLPVPPVPSPSFFVKILNRLFHAKHFHSLGSSIGKFPIEIRVGRHDIECVTEDIELANQMVCLYQKLVNVVHDPTSMMNINRDPFIMKDAESLMQRYQEIVDALEGAHNHGDDHRLLSMIRRPLYLYH